MEQRNFNEIIKFSRLTNGTAIDQQGALVLFAADQPRFDHDSITLAKQGILVEDQSTNLVLQSSTLNISPWVSTSVTLAQQPVSALGSLLTSFRLTETVTNSKHNVSQQVNTVLNTKYTFSVFVKAGVRTRVCLELISGSTKLAYFDLSTKQVLSQQDCTAVIVPFVDNWCRVSVSFTAGATSTTCNINLATADGVNSYTGSTSAYLDVQGVQLEPSSYLTSYIPTTSTQVTRAEDLVYLESPSKWYSKGVGTLFVEATSPHGVISESVGQCVLSMSDNQRDNYMNINRTNTELINIQSIRAYDQVWDFDQTSWVKDSTKRIAYAFDAYGFTTWVNSVKQTDSAIETPSTSVNALNTYDSKNFGGWIRKIKFYPWTMQEEELKELTS